MAALHGPFLPSPTGLAEVLVGRAFHGLHRHDQVAIAILVLVAHVSGSANEATAAGATWSLGARVVYAPAYIAGIPYLRTLAFGVGLAGELRILGAIL